VRAPVDLKLRMQSGPPLRIAPADAEVVLRDADGAPHAYGSRDADGFRIHFPGLADFSVRRGEDAIVAETRAPSAVVHDLFRTAVVPLALQASGYEALHASAVRVDTGVAAFCGFSGSGKSTVAFGLGRRGYPLWGDDAVVFAAGEEGNIRCFPIPFTLSLRDASREFFGVRTQSLQVVEDRRQASTLAAVVVLERSSDEAPGVERVSFSDAVRLLLPHAYRFTLADRTRTRQTVETYLDLATSVPVIRARYEPGFSELPALLDTIENALPDVERA
jgi:hypothetical protein